MAAGKVVFAAASVWGPYKDLQAVVDAAVHKQQNEAVHDLELMLKKHKPDFLAFLKNMPKNAGHRDAVKKSNTVGLPVHGEQGTQTFQESVIQEALIISDLFDLNEYVALELLIAGEDKRADFPGLARGLVAVLLYYDGRRSLVSALRTLMLALEGRTWTLELPRDLTHLAQTFINTLVDENLVNKILSVLKTMNLTKELDKLQNNRALGPPSHRKQIEEMYSEIEVTCAECVLCLACQRGLSRQDTLQLIDQLRTTTALRADGSLPPAILALLMALLYCCDISILEREDAEDLTGSLVVFRDPQYVIEVHRELRDGPAWQVPGLRAVVQLAWGNMLRQLSHYPQAAGFADVYEEDEMMIDLALDGQVFRFLNSAVLKSPKIQSEEFHMRRLHSLLTDFIFQMPLKVKELRNRGDETARIVLAHAQEGEEPPASLRRDFEDLLNLVGNMYKENALGLDLSADYWCPTESSGHNDTLHQRPPHRQVSLYKFVRMAGDLLPASLYVPYVHMLTGLASTPQTAAQCYHLLKMNGSTSSTVSWEHMFASLNQYLSVLRQEWPVGSAGDQSQRLMSRNITAQELEGLLSVLRLIRTVCEQNETCRVAMCENQHWNMIWLLFGMVSCSVPLPMKAELLHTLASVSRTPEIAATLWQTLESSQILVTVPSSSGKPAGGIQVELEEVEARGEEYPMTQAFLSLLNTLTDTPVPPGLGAGLRAPGFDPYLHYILNDVFLKFPSRAYKDQGEKWSVSTLCLEILYKLLKDYEMSPEHFTDQLVEGQSGAPVVVNKPPGYNLLINMLRDTRLFQMVMRILDDTMKHLETYTNIPGESSLEQTSLLCLRLLEESLVKEAGFVGLVRETGTNLILTPLDRLLLTINPRTGKADFIVTIAKYLVFNSRLPEHSLAATKILYYVCKASHIQADLITLFTENKDVSTSLLHGFVECMEVDEPETCSEVITETSTRNATRQHIVKLIINSLCLPAPNLAHFLLGFELRKPVSKTNLQDPGILTSPKTCLHSLVSLLSRGVGSSGPQCLQDTPVLAELMFRLVYLLAANKDTSLPTLRYLRTSHDFLYRQCQHLPYEQRDNGESVSAHQSWLLKTVAVELRVTSLNRQRSHTNRLVRLLLDDWDEDQTSVLQPVGGSEETEYYSMSRTVDPSSAFTQTVRGEQYRRRIMSLLDTVKFDQLYPEPMQLEHFDTALLQQVLQSIEHVDDQGIKYYDVKQLHAVLQQEITSAHSATVPAQRQRIIEEIGHILKVVIARNRVCLSLHEKQQSFDSWRQVVEVILTACPSDTLPAETRHTVLLEILHELLNKVADDSALPELTAPVAGVILTLMANLRQCFLSPDTDGRTDPASRYVALLESDRRGAEGGAVSWGQGGSSVTGLRTQFATSMQVVLRGLIDHILRASGGQQRVRAKLYGALLYYLQIANPPSPQYRSLGVVDRRLGGDTDVECEQLQRDNISTILTHGDAFMDLLCRDAADGLDVGRMLSLSVLDCILTMDKFQQCLTFLSSRGYLQHLVDSLSADDDQLNAVLASDLDDLKVLYLYESKMSLLTKVGETAAGALTLLRSGVMDQLARCTFLALRPPVHRGEVVSMEDEGFLPDRVSRYRHVLFTTLRFCLALLTSLGVENRDAGTQVMQFIISHKDVFHAILMGQTDRSNLHVLQELALTTAVISRASANDDDQYEEFDTMNVELRSYRSEMHRHMLSLLPHHCVSDQLGKLLRQLDSQQHQEQQLSARLVQAQLEVATNITSYYRALVTNSGTGAQYSRMVFRPSLEEALSRDRQSGTDIRLSGVGVSQLPSLGVLVYQMKQCSQQFLTVYESRAVYNSKLEGLSDLSIEDLKQFSGLGVGEKLSSQQRQQLARKKLSQLISCKNKQLELYSHVLENSLFLLYRHLEYYLIQCVPVDRGQTPLQARSRRHQIRRLQDLGLGSPVDAGAGGDGADVEDSSRQYVRQQEIDTLKQTAVAVLSDSFFKTILDINQTFGKSRSHYGFVEAVIRRIKRLLRLHTAT